MQSWFVMRLHDLTNLQFNGQFPLVHRKRRKSDTDEYQTDNNHGPESSVIHSRTLLSRFASAWVSLLRSADCAGSVDER